ESVQSFLSSLFRVRYPLRTRRIVKDVQKPPLEVLRARSERRLDTLVRSRRKDREQEVQQREANRDIKRRPVRHHSPPSETVKPVDGLKSRGTVTSSKEVETRTRSQRQLLRELLGLLDGRGTITHRAMYCNRSSDSFAARFGNCLQSSDA